MITHATTSSNHLPPRLSKGTLVRPKGSTIAESTTASVRNEQATAVHERERDPSLGQTLHRASELFCQCSVRRSVRTATYKQINKLLVYLKSFIEIDTSNTNGID